MEKKIDYITAERLRELRKLAEQTPHKILVGETQRMCRYTKRVVISPHYRKRSAIDLISCRTKIPVHVLKDVFSGRTYTEER